MKEQDTVRERNAGMGGYMQDPAGKKPREVQPDWPQGCHWVPVVIIYLSR